MINNKAQEFQLERAIHSNSAHLGNEKVRKNLEQLDRVIAKIDAPNEGLFKRINRPSSGAASKKLFKI